MKTNTYLSTISNNSTLRQAAFLFGAVALITLQAHGAQGTLPTFKEAATQENGGIGAFFESVTKVLMYVMAVVSIVITVLAFKGLAGQGDWRSFWNKIAGAIGMFAVPAIMNWLLTGK